MKEVKSCFYWREHPSVLAPYFRTLSAQVEGGKKAGAKAKVHITLAGSSKEGPPKKLRKVIHD